MGGGGDTIEEVEKDGNTNDERERETTLETSTSERRGEISTKELGAKELKIDRSTMRLDKI